MTAKKLTAQVEEWFQDFGKEHGYELSRAEYVKEEGGKVLRLYVDKVESEGYGSLSTDDCEYISKFIGKKLDEIDPVKESYFLEVSSPGLDRVLVKDGDFERFMGSAVEIKTYEPISGKRFLEGNLAGFDSENIIITQSDGGNITVPRKKAAKVNLAVFF